MISMLSIIKTEVPQSIQMICIAFFVSLLIQSCILQTLFVFQAQLCFPEEGLVYDYHLDDAGISCFDEEEEDGKERKVSMFSGILQLIYKTFLRDTFD